MSPLREITVPSNRSRRMTIVAKCPFRVITRRLLLRGAQRYWGVCVVRDLCWLRYRRSKTLEIRGAHCTGTSRNRRGCGANGVLSGKKTRKNRRRAAVATVRYRRTISFIELRASRPRGPPRLPLARLVHRVQLYPRFDSPPRVFFKTYLYERNQRAAVMTRL